MAYSLKRCNPRDYLETNLYDAHVGKGLYAMQLSRWFAVFGKENFKVSCVFSGDTCRSLQIPVRNLLARYVNSRDDFASRDTLAGDMV